MYEALWDKMFELIPPIKHSVNHVSSDYEPAMINAVKNKFPPENEVKISICDFHHKQVKFYGIFILHLSNSIQKGQKIKKRGEEIFEKKILASAF